ncbi:MULTISPECIES: hypothetical protein [Streptomyces]|uniref:hypothetical protein n=1 Tax=Streptomyces TaxID=1883 RepID=UPI002E2D7584|nr:hypothetical protein [Streptomyces sp. NBC_00269]
MKLTRRFATISTAATATLLLSAGGAQAQGDGGLLSLLGNSSLVQVCYPMGQVGNGNVNTGTQNMSCSQNAQVTTPANGAGGVTGAQRVFGEGVEIPPGGSGESSVLCPAGKIATGGGPFTFAPGFRTEESIALSTPSGPPDSWTVRGTNEGSESIVMRVEAVCVNGTQ